MAVTPTPGPGWVTIDELAQATGLTVRTVRDYQTRGLLPPPEVRARTGFYGPEHRARLDLVRELQAEGVGLSGVHKLLATTGESVPQLLAFLRRVGRGPAPGPRPITGSPELAARFAVADPGLLRQAVRLHLLREVGEGSYEEVEPRLGEHADALVGLGVPLPALLELVSPLRRQADAVAKIAVELFLSYVWRPFDAAGRPDERWPEVSRALEELPEVVGQALSALVDTAVAERLQVTFGREINRNVRRRTGSSDGPADKVGP